MSQVKYKINKNDIFFLNSVGRNTENFKTLTQKVKLIK